MSDSLPDWAYAAALAALPLQTHHRLRRVMAIASPRDAWNVVRESAHARCGVSAEVWTTWRSVHSHFVEEIFEDCQSSDVSVVTRSDATYPRQLLLDAEAPAVLFVAGHLPATPVRRVGIVGTRAATQFGKHFARQLGRDLASHGVSVVSGLARGIDVEAHDGALQSLNGEAPLAVVAGGPNVVYPREHRGIWKVMQERGAIISEYPPHRKPEAYRFPLRNRVLAALSDVLVVVESRSTGGSMLTVNEAMKRGITVMAVPGSPRVTPSEGTNGLLRDGCAPVTDIGDVLVALGLDTQRFTGTGEVRLPLSAEHLRVIDAMGDMPRTIDEISLLLGVSLVDCAVTLGRLEEQGWVAQSDGWWEALTR